VRRQPVVGGGVGWFMVGVGGVRPDERALKQRTRWTGFFFLVLQGLATSPAISAGPQARRLTMNMHAVHDITVVMS